LAAGSGRILLQFYLLTRTRKVPPLISSWLRPLTGIFWLNQALADPAQQTFRSAIFNPPPELSPAED
jgi:hypothetical protein